jgi:hypothetical protein
MKFYETTYEEYINSIEKYNIHPELMSIPYPDKVKDLGNLIVYGPPGTGKYTQVLKIIKKYSLTNLKYTRILKVQTEKAEFSYRISDIHYEIDFSLLGCNAKQLWNEIFLQIIDIITVKQEKNGIIVCSNFHKINNELLEIFYSYIYQYNNILNIKYIIITENISFFPNKLLDSCLIINVCRPCKKKYQKIICKESILDELSIDSIINIKELKDCQNIDDLSDDLFNTICDTIYNSIISFTNFDFLEFREKIYKILIYNLDISEVIWEILTKLINNNKIKCEIETLNYIYDFHKLYNNNYRSIFHLERIFFYFINLVSIHDTKT